MNNPESHLQSECVKYFRLAFPKMARLLFAVPNGGARNKVTAANLKREGVVPGVADLILLTSRRGYGSLCIEMKTPKAKQSPKQKEWQQIAEYYGNCYQVCHSFDEFKKIVNWYLD